MNNFLIILQGLRCPVFSSDFKRTLIIRDVPQLTEDELVREMEHNNIEYFAFDYPLVYNSPQRKIARPYRGNVTLTFKSHEEARLCKLKFDSSTGVLVCSDSTIICILTCGSWEDSVHLLTGMIVIQ